MSIHLAAFNIAEFIFINRKDPGSKALTLNSHMTENTFFILLKVSDNIKEQDGHYLCATKLAEHSSDTSWKCELVDVHLCVLWCLLVRELEK